MGVRVRVTCEQALHAHPQAHSAESRGLLLARSGNQMTLNFVIFFQAWELAVLFFTSLLLRLCGEAASISKAPAPHAVRVAAAAAL